MALSLNEFDHVVLGGEKQAAVSAAQAYPEERFLFLTDHEVVDGWDLENVDIAFCTPEQWHEQKEGEHSIVPLCSRWVEAYAGLSSLLEQLHHHIEGVVLPVHHTSASIEGSWIKKGGLFHKPDAIEVGEEDDAMDQDPYGCGISYQPFIKDIDTHYQVVGWYGGDGEVYLGMVRVLNETFGREPFLLAGETVQYEELEKLSIEVLRTVNKEGFFTMNWVHSSGQGLLMTSIRPVAKSVFGTFRKGGFDLLRPQKGRRKIAKEGVKFMVEQHYSSYEHPDLAIYGKA